MSNTPVAGNCWNCAQGLVSSDYGRGDSCPKCGRDTRCCKGCKNFDPNKHNECHEPQADRVVDKERSNFCDYFKPASRTDGSQYAKALDARAAAEALFKKGK